MVVTSIAYVAYPAQDVQRLAAFYRDVIGLKVRFSFLGGSIPDFVEFEVGPNDSFAITTEEMLGRLGGDGSDVVFEVADIDRTLSELRTHPIRVDDRTKDYPGCRMASFDDPEGNTVGLHQISAERANEKVIKHA